MRNMTGAATARLLSEVYREKGSGSDLRAYRAARGSLERDADPDEGAGPERTLDRAERDAA
jgi:hypothetical protein